MVGATVVARGIAGWTQQGLTLGTSTSASIQASQWVMAAGFYCSTWRGVILQW